MINTNHDPDPQRIHFQPNHHSVETVFVRATETVLFYFMSWMIYRPGSLSPAVPTASNCDFYFSGFPPRLQLTLGGHSGVWNILLPAFFHISDLQFPALYWVSWMCFFVVYYHFIKTLIPIQYFLNLHKHHLGQLFQCEACLCIIFFEIFVNNKNYEPHMTFSRLPLSLLPKSHVQWTSPRCHCFFLLIFVLIGTRLSPRYRKTMFYCRWILPKYLLGKTPQTNAIKWIKIWNLRSLLIKAAITGYISLMQFQPFMSFWVPDAQPVVIPEYPPIVHTQRRKVHKRIHSAPVVVHQMRNTRPKVNLNNRTVLRSPKL